MVELRIGCKRFDQMVSGGAQAGRIGLVEGVGHREGYPRMCVGQQFQNRGEAGGGKGRGGRGRKGNHVNSIYGHFSALKMD